MSIESQLEELNQIKTNIFTSISNKGVIIPENPGLKDAAELIDSIESGITPIIPEDIIFVNKITANRNSGSSYDVLIFNLNDLVYTDKISGHLAAECDKTNYYQGLIDMYKSYRRGQIGYTVFDDHTNFASNFCRTWDSVSSVRLEGKVTDFYFKNTLGEFSVNGINGTYSASSYSDLNGTSLEIFSSSGSGNAVSIIDFFELIITDANDKKKHHFVPVVYQNKAGILDIVTGAIKTGTNNTYGYEIYPAF